MLKKIDFKNVFVGSPVADSSRGLFLGIAMDCAGDPLGGLSFAIDTSDASTVLGHALPSATHAILQSNCADAALSSSQVGIAFALKIPLGSAQITTTLLGGPALGVTSVPFRAGRITALIDTP